MAEDLIEGILRCTRGACQSEFPVLDGIPIIVPNVREYVGREILQLTAREDLSPLLESLIGDCAGPGSAYDTARQQVSSYAWDHWADLEPEIAAPGPKPGSARRLAVAVLEHLRQAPPGPQLEAGCATGRVTFEAAACTSELVLGIDLNFAMLRVASRVLRQGVARFPQKRVGLVFDRREISDIQLPGAERVDFWACDLAAPPFGPGTFAAALGLNLVDSLQAPAATLSEVSRLLRPAGRIGLACPYDWSPGATPVESWLGGHSQRADHAGSSEKILHSLLEGEGLEILHEAQEHTWHVRLHDRAAVEYLSHVIVAGKRAHE